MSNQHRDYAYSTGEDRATDSYLEGVAGKRVEKFSTDVQDGATWYTAANDGRPRYRNNCSRIIVLVFNVILLLAGIGVCVLGRVEKDKKVLPLCPSCEHFVTALYIFGGCLILIGLMGIGAGFTRFKPLAIIYAIIVMLLALAMIAAGFAVVVYETGMKEADLEKLWTEAVDDKEQFICTLQDKLQCSGFHVCCRTLPNSTISAPACNATKAEIIAQCDTRCVATNDKYIEPCNNKVEDEVKAHFKPLIGVTFGLAFVLIIVVIAAVRMTLRS